MILTAVKMKGQEGKRQEIVQTLAGITDRVKGCRGCIGAHCYQDITDANTFYHVQEWRSRRDLDDHLNSPLFAALMGIRTILEDSPQVEVMYRSGD